MALSCTYVDGLDGFASDLHANIIIYKYELPPGIPSRMPWMPWMPRDLWGGQGANQSKPAYTCPCGGLIVFIQIPSFLSKWGRWKRFGIGTWENCSLPLARCLFLCIVHHQKLCIILLAANRKPDYSKGTHQWNTSIRRSSENTCRQRLSITVVG